MAYGNTGVFPLRTPGSNGYAVGLRFVTDGSGDETLEDDYDGIYSIARSTNTYTITGPAVGSWKSVVVGQSLYATVNCVVTKDAAAGTLTFAFSTDFDSATCDIVAFASDSLNG